jgi:FKBP-type peptidyl-prolyl cis-trans isomerase
VISSLARRFRPYFLVPLALAVAAGVGCEDAPTAPTSFASFTQTDVVAGAGAEAATGSLLTVNYTGWLFDGSKPENKGLQFDSSIGTTPFTFTLGVGEVIVGWDRGLVGMRAGGVRRLVIPPSLAYGANRNGIIPPNATLVFDVALLEVQ